MTLGCWGSDPGVVAGYLGPTVTSWRTLSASLLLATCALLTARPALAERPRLIVLNLGASSEKLKPFAESISEQLLTELGRSGRLEAMGASDVSAVLGLERQKSMLGCADASTSCLAEVSAALGAPWLVTGNLAQAGKTMRVDLKLIRAKDGKAVYRDGRVIKDEAQIFDVVSEMAKAMVASMNLPLPDAPVKPAEVTPVAAPVATHPVEVAPAVEAAATPPLRVAPWVVLGAGVVAAGLGAAFLVSGAGARRDTLGALAQAPNQTGPSTVPTAAQARTQLEAANTTMTVGGVVGGAGLLAAGAGVAWLLLGAPAEGANVAVSVVPGPGVVTVGGTF